MKDNEQKRVENIAKAYDSVDTADRFFRATPTSNMFDRIRDREFQAVFSNLDFNSLPSKEPLALDIGIGGGTLYEIFNRQRY